MKPHRRRYPGRDRERSKALKNRLLYPLAGFVLAMFLLTGCGGTAPNPTGSASTPATSAATVPPASTPTVSQSDMRAAVIAALHSVAQRAHRSESEIAFTDGKTITTTVEFVPPDKKRFVSPDNDTIVVDNKVYNRSKGEADWTLLQADAAQFSYPSFNEDLGDIQFLGPENLDGKPVLVYKTSLSNKDTGTTTIFTYWISPADGLLYRLVNDGEVSTVDSSTGKMKLVPAITTSIFKYDPNIQIAAPVK